MKIGYLVHNLNDPAVERRCVMLERGGATVRLAGFCRDRCISPTVAARSPLPLGQTGDARMVARTLGTAWTVLRSDRLRKYFRDCDVLVARNLEQLAVARRVADGRPIVYECLDIHRLLTGRGGAASLVRAIEARLLPGVALLLTSSPAFVRSHFAHRPITASVSIIENKLLVQSDEATQAQAPSAVAPLRIGWFGMLRCRTTLEFLTRLAASAEGRIEILIAGKPSPAEVPDLVEWAAAHDGIEFHGPYAYADLPGLYGRCHFAWAVDWFEEGANSSWLLPNRLYEALAHGAIPIALSTVETGRWLLERECGLVVDAPEEIVGRLARMSPEALAIMQRRVAALDRRQLVADDRDCRMLVASIEELVAA